MTNSISSSLLRAIEFSGEIRALPQGPLANEEFQRFLARLIALPTDVTPRDYNRLMNDFMRHKIVDNTDNEAVGHHTLVANLVTASPNQLHRYCRYLVETKQLNRLNAWVGCRCLEQYPLLPEEQEAVLKDYLTQQTKSFISAFSRKVPLTVRYHQRPQPFGDLKYKAVEIDPRVWFGPSIAGPQISPLLIDVIARRVKQLCDKYPLPVEVTMRGREELEIPLDYTLPLVERIMNENEKVYMVTGGTINREQITPENRTRMRDIGSLSIDERHALSERYPDALERLSSE